MTDNSDKKTLRWIPLEADPDVYTSWSKGLGLNTEKLQYHDVLGLDQMLLDMVPKPSVAVLLLYPITKENEELKVKQDEDVEQSTKGGEQEGCIWFKQTIGNACGTMGLIHAIGNSSAKSHLSSTSPLLKLLSDSIPLNPLERADLLINSKELEQTHSTNAQAGQSVVPTADSRVDLHFTAFVRNENGDLIELDGRRKGPLNRGKVEKQEDLLEVTAKFVQENYMSLNPDEHNFSLIALAPPSTD